MLAVINAHNLAILCNGHWHEGRMPEAPLTALSIDSRQTGPGMLFAALPGERADGHDFVGTLSRDNTQAALVLRPVPGAGCPQLVVSDVTAAVQEIARHAAAATTAKKIAVTGSVGKTGTKDMLASLLSLAGRVHATKGNLNNHLGVPLTLASLPGDAEFLVCEMGMNHAGEIARLSELVRPDIALITCIAESHAGHFESLSDIAEAKAEIFSGTSQSGAAVISRDDRFYSQLAGAARLAGVKNIISFGQHTDSTVRLDKSERCAGGLMLSVSIAGAGTGDTRRNMHFHLSMHGRHWALNALAAIAAVCAAGTDIEPLLPAFSQMSEPPGRGLRHQLSINSQNIVLIDDSYNASPASMRAALEDLRESGAHAPVVILSDMLELGQQSHDAHLALAPLIAAAGAVSVITAGPRMRAMCTVLPQNLACYCYEDADALKTALQSTDSFLPDSADMLLVKGSHGSGAYKISQYLIASHSRQPAGPAQPSGGASHAA